LNDDELLALLKDSEFEENFSAGDFDFDSEEDDDEEYTVEQDIVVPLQSPNNITANISTASSSHDLPTGSPSRVIQPHNHKIWTSSLKNPSLIPFVGTTGML